MYVGWMLSDFEGDPGGPGGRADDPYGSHGWSLAAWMRLVTASGRQYEWLSAEQLPEAIDDIDCLVLPAIYALDERVVQAARSHLIEQPRQIERVYFAALCFDLRVGTLTTPDAIRRPGNYNQANSLTRWHGTGDARENVPRSTEGLVATDAIFRNIHQRVRRRLVRLEYLAESGRAPTAVGIASPELELRSFRFRWVAR